MLSNEEKGWPAFAQGLQVLSDKNCQKKPWPYRWEEINALCEPREGVDFHSIKQVIRRKVLCISDHEDWAQKVKTSVQK